MIENKIKILYIIPAEGFGGAEKQAVLHISYLPLFDIESIVITGPGDRIMKHFRKRNIEVLHFAQLPTEYGKPFNLIHYLIYCGKTIFNWIFSIIKVFKIARENNIELIFASRVVGWFIAGPVSKILGTPCIWRFGSCVHGKWRKFGLKILTSLFKPDLIISNCNAITSSVNGISNIQIMEVPNGVELPATASLSAHSSFKLNLNIDSNIPIIGLAARPSPDKGMHFLSDVISKVNETGRIVHFCVAGEFGWRNSIEKYFKTDRLIQNISFLGHIDDISNFYLNCQIIILTSSNHSIEGLSNALMEAMALGKPVISTNVGGISSLIEHDKNGILIDSENFAGFASEIINLIDNPNKRKLMGDMAKKSILLNYEAKKTVQTLSRLIKHTSKKYYSVKKTKHTYPNFY